MYRPEGIMASVVTPFDKEGNLDYEAMRNELTYLVDTRVDGFGIAVNTGEFTSLTVEEVFRLTDMAVEIAGGKKKVIIGALAPSLHTNLEIANYAKRAGADALLISPPYYISPDDDGLFEYFSRVGAVGIPMIIFNIPERCPCNLMPPLIERLMAIDTFVGIKECDPSFSRVCQKLQMMDPRIGYLMGYLTMSLPHFLMGGDGGFFSAGCLIPDLLADMFQAAKSGKIKEAREMFARVLRINDAIMVGSNHPAGIKEAMTMRGIYCGYTRAPLGQCTEAQKEKIRKVLTEEGLL